MVVVAYPERFFVQGPDDDHHCRIKKGQGEDQQGDQDREAGKRVADVEETDLRCRDCGEKSEEVTSGVPHENSGGRHVVEPESAADTAAQS